MLKILSFIAVLIAVEGASAQVRTFRWESPACEHTGTYNAKKYTDEQLRNTSMLFALDEHFKISANATVWKYEDIANLSVADLDREYEQKSTRLKTMKIVGTPYWEAVRQAKLKELEQVYRLSRVTMEAYTKPAVLNGYAAADSCKLKYAGPIERGGEDLIDVWRQVNLDSQKKNSDPGRLQRRFDEENASPDRLKFAIVETMAFGWWNCANEFIEYEPKSSDGSAEEQFKKLFGRVKSRCDEP